MNHATRKCHLSQSYGKHEHAKDDLVHKNGQQLCRSERSLEIISPPSEKAPKVSANLRNLQMQCRRE